MRGISTAGEDYLPIGKAWHTPGAGEAPHEIVEMNQMSNGGKWSAGCGRCFASTVGLLADKLLRRQNPIKNGSAVLHLTELGQRVMLARVDYEIGEVGF